MTVTEAAERLGVQDESVRQAIRRGRLRAKKVGAQWWITPAALEVYRLRSLGRPGRPVTTGAGLRRKDRRPKEEAS